MQQASDLRGKIVRASSPRRSSEMAKDRSHRRGRAAKHKESEDSSQSIFAIGSDDDMFSDEVGSPKYEFREFAEPPMLSCAPGLPSAEPHVEAVLNDADVEFAAAEVAEEEAAAKNEQAAEEEEAAEKFAAERADAERAAAETSAAEKAAAEKVEVEKVANKKETVHEKNKDGEPGRPDSNEKRQDPSDFRWYTYAQIRKHYASYSEKECLDYWFSDCKQQKKSAGKGRSKR
jgi:hypothetical protein